MDKLERYLDQVCRGIAGPRSLRKHVREELREHITDAAADHRAAGLSEEAALDKALEDFGGPDQVHSELEAAHGHSLLAVIVDNAMAWKEQTMKAKVVWTAFAHVMLQLTVAAQITLLGLVVIFVVPKQMQLLREVLTRAGVEQMDGAILWSAHTLTYLRDVANHFLWIVLVSLVITVLFEWRVRSDHKPFIRLASLGVLALGLTIEIGCVMAALILPWLMLVPGHTNPQPEPLVSRQLSILDKEAAALRELLAKPQWSGEDRDALVSSRASAHSAIDTLSRLGPAAPAVVSMRESPDTVAAVRDDLQTAAHALRRIEAANHADRSYERTADRTKLEADLREFLDAYGRVRDPERAPKTQPAK